MPMNFADWMAHKINKFIIICRDDYFFFIVAFDFLIWTIYLKRFKFIFRYSHFASIQFEFSFHWCGDLVFHIQEPRHNTDYKLLYG